MSEALARSGETEILELKSVLEDAKCSQDGLMQALQRLKGLGPLPVDVLKKSLIGKSVKHLTTRTPYEKVKVLAQDLEQDWRRAYREWVERGKTARQDLKETDAPQLKKARLSAHESSKTDSSTTVRQTVRRLLSETLSKCYDSCRALESTNSCTRVESPPTTDPHLLAEKIENALHVHMASNVKEYRAQARAVCFNLKDERNIAFRLKLMLGYLAPEQVPTLTAEDMASDEKKAFRKEIRRESLEAADADWDSKHAQGEQNGMFPCESCQSVNTTNFQIPSGKPDTAPTIVVICLSCGHRSNIQDKQC